MVGDHSLWVKYHTFCCSNVLKVYEKPDGGVEERFQFLWVDGHSLSVGYHSFCCSNAPEVFEKPNGGSDKRFHFVG